ncbi:MAG: alkaline phosphatase [Betaproteobacteria bacterium]|jgi:alkaline phosphatase|nr:alkaline phosphatase [Betaproteobacteria bacterium]
MRFMFGWLTFSGLVPASRLFLAALLSALALVTSGCAGTGLQQSGAAPKNIIILFADGAAPVQWDFGKRSSEILRGQSFAVTDIVFRDGVLGLLSTHPHGPYVTDSAAAASAMSTGYKVENGAVSITPDGQSRTTLMQAAKAAGKRIGLVTTATVYDATPAAFSINVRSRRDSQQLVDLYAVLRPDVLMGGGADYFMPSAMPGGKRRDGRDVIAEFRDGGHAVARSTAELREVSAPRLLGLFAAGDMAFELDRDPAAEPSTAEMTVAALRALSQDSPRGFVLLVENENTDTAGHANDAPSLMRALWAFDDAVKVALEFQRRNPDTLVIVTGDHETGGFSPTYAQKDLASMASANRFTAGDEQFRMLERVSMSLGMLREKLGNKPEAATLDALIGRHFPGFRFDDDLRALLLAGKPLERNFTYIPHNLIGRMVSRQTGFYWGTSGHTSEPVAVGAIGPGAELFRGYQDNTDFGKHLHRLLGR